MGVVAQNPPQHPARNNPWRYYTPKIRQNYYLLDYGNYKHVYIYLQMMSALGLTFAKGGCDFTSLGVVSVRWSRIEIRIRLLNELFCLIL